MKFVGLFDTVSSIGYGLFPGDIGWDNNTDAADFHLTAISVAERVVQLAAADEHRDYFPLTNINSKGGGTQIWLPGAHSDVGGGYTNNEYDRDYQILDLDNPNPEDPAMLTLLNEAIARDRALLVAQGWYLDREFRVNRATHEVCVNRGPIINTYSRIPLQMMGDFAREKALVFLPALGQTHYVPSGLRPMEQRVRGAMASTRDYWLRARDNDMKTLRRQFLHFSARYGEVGHWPRWTRGGSLSGQRRRHVLDG